MSLDNQDSLIIPLTLDGLSSINVDSLNLNGQEGVVQCLQGGDAFASYSVKLDEILPASIGTMINIQSNILINEKLGINGAPVSATLGINLGGNINITGQYLVNGLPLSFSGSNWTIKGTGDIYRNSKVGVGDFSAPSATMYYDLQLGAVNTSTAGNKYISIPVLIGSDSGIKFTENSGGGANNEFGFQLRYRGAGLDNRFEILSGNGTPLADFANRSITIARDTGNMSIGSSIDLNRPLSVYGGALTSEQLRVWSASNASIGIRASTTGTLELCVANNIGAFGADAVIGDSIIRGQVNRKMYIQNGVGNSAIAIDTTNNVGIGVNTSILTNKMTISGSLAITNNNIFVLGTTNGIQLGNSAISIQNGIFRDNLGGVALWASNNTAFRSNSAGEVAMGATIPVSGVRLTTDGSIRANGNVDIRGGVLQFNGLTASTSNILEGSNQYYLDSRARQAISVTSSGGLSLTYNSSNGLISGTITATQLGSYWTLVPEGIYRDSSVAINTSFVSNVHALNIGLNTSINKGIFIQSNYTGNQEEIIRYKNIDGGVDYYQNFDTVNGFENHVLNNSAMLYNNWGVDKDNYFYTRNPYGGGIGMKFYSPTMSATSGATIFFEGGPSNTLNIINQEIGGNLEFWTNSGVGVNERWRISASGSLNNVGLEDSVNALRVTGNILLNNIRVTANSILTTTGNLILGLNGSTQTTTINISGLSTNQITCSFINTSQINGLGLITTQIYNVVGAYPNNFNTANFVKTSATSKIRVHLRASAMQTAIVNGSFFFGLYNAITNAYMAKFVTYNHIHNYANNHWFWGGMMLMNDTNVGVPAGSYYLRITFTNLFNNSDDYCYIAVDESN